MINVTDTVKAVAVTAQAGMGAVSVADDPRLTNAIIQIVIVIVTAIIANFKKKK